MNVTVPCLSNTMGKKKDALKEPDGKMINIYSHLVRCWKHYSQLQQHYTVHNILHEYFMNTSFYVDRLIQCRFSHIL